MHYGEIIFNFSAPLTNEVTKSSIFSFYTVADSGWYLFSGAKKLVVIRLSLKLTTTKFQWIFPEFLIRHYWHLKNVKPDFANPCIHLSKSNRKQL